MKGIGLPKCCIAVIAVEKKQKLSLFLAVPQSREERHEPFCRFRPRWPIGCGTKVLSV